MTAKMKRFLYFRYNNQIFDLDDPEVTADNFNEVRDKNPTQKVQIKRHFLRHHVPIGELHVAADVSNPRDKPMS